MQRYDTQTISPAALAVGGAILAYLMLKSLANSIGLDIAATGQLVLGTLMCIGLIGYAIWNEITNDGWFGLQALLPAALASGWAGLWPAMQTWGARPLYLPGMPLDDSNVAFWASSYVQWGGYALLLVGGYAFSYARWKYWR